MRSVSVSLSLSLPLSTRYYILTNLRIYNSKYQLLDLRVNNTSVVVNSNTLTRPKHNLWYSLWTRVVILHDNIPTDSSFSLFVEGSCCNLLSEHLFSVQNVTLNNIRHFPFAYLAVFYLNQQHPSKAYFHKLYQ